MTLASVPLSTTQCAFQEKTPISYTPFYLLFYYLLSFLLFFFQWHARKAVDFVVEAVEEEEEEEVAMFSIQFYNSYGLKSKHLLAIDCIPRSSF